jgi:hypothetical protein
VTAKEANVPYELQVPSERQRAKNDEEGMVDATAR